MNFLHENSRLCSLEVLCTPEQLSYTAYPLRLPSDTETFFRPARSSVLATPKRKKELPVGLDALLAAAEEEFAFMHEELGLSVIGHEWGLVEHPSSTLESRRYAMARLVQLLTPGRSYIPKGHLLVAKVDYVDTSVPVNAGKISTAQDVLGANGLYYATRKGKLRLSDAHEGQAKTGINYNQDANTSRVQEWFLDVDPLLILT